MIVLFVLLFNFLPNLHSNTLKFLFLFSDFQVADNVCSRVLEAIGRPADSCRWSLHFKSQEFNDRIPRRVHRVLSVLLHYTNYFGLRRRSNRTIRNKLVAVNYSRDSNLPDRTADFAITQFRDAISSALQTDTVGSVCQRILTSNEFSKDIECGLVQSCVFDRWKIRCPLFK